MDPSRCDFMVFYFKDRDQILNVFHQEFLPLIFPNSFSLKTLVPVCYIKLKTKTLLQQISSHNLDKKCYIYDILLSIIWVNPF